MQVGGGRGRNHAELLGLCLTASLFCGLEKTKVSLGRQGLWQSLSTPLAELLPQNCLLNQFCTYFIRVGYFETWVGQIDPKINLRSKLYIKRNK